MTTTTKSSYMQKVLIGITATMAIIAVIMSWQFNVLQRKYVDSQISIDRLKLENQSLVRDKELHAKSEALTKQTITDLQEQLKKKSQVYDQANAIVNDKVEAITKKYDKLEKNDVNRIAMEKEISAARITGLWKAYCIANPEHERCKK